MFRLAISMAAGIFFEETFRLELGYFPLLALVLLLFLLGMLLRRHSYGNRWLFGAGVSAFMFLFGWMLTEYAWKEVKVDWNEEEQIYRGRILEHPIEKQRTYQCRVGLMGKEVLLYLPKDSLSATLQIGDELLLYARISAPRNIDAFQDFDYERYLYHDGVSGTAYVPKHAWKKTDEERDMGLKQRALYLRGKIVEKYTEWGIAAEQLPVLSALTLGHKGLLDKQTRNAYSVAGISHVLALSGMHIGIVWFLLNAVLGRLMRNRFKGLQWLLVTSALWVFAFVVGLEASVVRAVMMCMLMELGRLTNSRPLSMNTLMVAAFFMLAYHPFYLFDVGFQLSFVAVASILVLYPVISGSLSIRHSVGKWLWNIMSVSLAAQLGTAPLVMYYFSNFSVYFLVANLAVAIAVPLIIYGAFLMVLLAPWPALQIWVVKMLDGLVAGMNGLAGWTSGLPYASVSFSVWKPVEILFFYGVLACGVMYGQKRQRRWLIRGLLAVVCLLGLHWGLILWGDR